MPTSWSACSSTGRQHRLRARRAAQRRARRPSQTGDFFPIGYDFDFSGAVNARTRRSIRSLGSHACASGSIAATACRTRSIPKAFALFNAKKDSIYGLYRDQIGKLLPPKIVEETLEVLRRVLQDHQQSTSVEAKHHRGMLGGKDDVVTGRVGADAGDEDGVPLRAAVGRSARRAGVRAVAVGHVGRRVAPVAPSRSVSRHGRRLAAPARHHLPDARRRQRVAAAVAAHRRRRTARGRRVSTQRDRRASSEPHGNRGSNAVVRRLARHRRSRAAPSPRRSGGRSPHATAVARLAAPAAAHRAPRPRDRPPHGTERRRSFFQMCAHQLRGDGSELERSSARSRRSMACALRASRRTSAPSWRSSGRDSRTFRAAPATPIGSSAP